MTYTVAALYRFVPISDVERLAADLKAAFSNLGIYGTELGFLCIIKSEEIRLLNTLNLSSLVYILFLYGKSSFSDIFILLFRK